MIVARTPEQAAGLGPAVLTIGNFDGVHAGHLELLRKARDLARAGNLRVAVLTFDPHPACIVAPARTPRLLTNLGQRCRLLERAGAELVYVVKFDQPLSQLMPDEFAREYLRGILHARAVVVGANFRFGAGQSGDVAVLERIGTELGFTTHAVPPVVRRGVVVSSSEIRRRVARGEVALAARLLERPYELEGEVVSGHGVGSKQTVPTLNLKTQAEVIPADGVYITRTTDRLDRTTWNSVSNIGMRPTFGGSERSIETHLLDSAPDSAPGQISVKFLCRMREERKFNDSGDLRRQILADIRVAGNFFRRCKTPKCGG